MKFMKLGSKPDLFHSNGENMRYVSTDLATDMIVNVGDVKFYLHKFPLLSKSGRFQKLVAVLDDENTKELEIHDIPGGPAAFEICAKFSYGMTVTLNPYNVISARCAAEYLEMYETIDKGNLVYKIEVFLNSSIFKTWKDLIIVFQTTKSLLPWSEELKVVNHCLDSIASKVSIDTSKVEWSYTYNRKNTGNGSPIYEKLKVPKDWWVEDLCDLSSDLYKRVIITIKTKGKVGLDVLGESLNAYTQKRLPWFGKEHGKKGGDNVKTQAFIETIIGLLPDEKQNICCGFLINLLHACVLLDGPETRKKELLRRIGLQLQNASVNDIVILDVDLVQELIAIFMMRDRSVENEFLEVKGVDLTAKVNVAKIIDGYLAEIAKDSSVTLMKFADLADMVSSLPRSSHDGIYRAIDMYLKEHPGIGKSEKKRICRLMDCRKLSPEACRHAVQNERLPLRVVVQVLFFEQIRAAATGGSTGGTLTDPAGTLPLGRSRGSSRTGTTNTEEEWGSVPTSEELKALEKDSGKTSKVKGVVMSKRIFMKVFSGKDRDSENGSSDTEETKSTSPAERSRRQSLS